MSQELYDGILPEQDSVAQELVLLKFLQREPAYSVNLGIVGDNEFQLIAYCGEICDRIPGSDDIDMPYFHFKPDLDLKDFLTVYGEAGGTHHIALTMGDRIEDMVKLAEMLNIDLIILG